MNHQDTKAPRITKWHKAGYEPVSQREDELARIIVDAAYKVHSQMGPGLLESVYEICFCHELSKRAIPFHPQVSLPVRYDNILLQAAVRLDILVEDLVICELKSVELLTPLFQSQLLTYLKLTGKRLGFLINFNVASIRDGIKRVIL